MKRLIIAILLVCSVLFIANTAFAEKTEAKESSLLRLCIWPGLWSWPTDQNIYGLQLGIPVSFNKKNTVAGVDAALGVSMAECVKGLRGSFLLNMGHDSSGVEFSTVNISKNFNGVSCAFFNQARKKSAILQLGIVNQAQDSKG
ncbi:MAG: hypothetical protein K9M56_04125, partial [Victivallales bacterium]|nr:hypothetical protein [Victivallales bacterium]